MMKGISYLSESVYVDKAKNKGRGMYTKRAIDAATIIEISPVVVLSAEDRKHIDKTLLHDYIFEWGRDKKRCCLALGYVSLYNHAYDSNCEYEMDFGKHLITIKTVRKVKSGEELFINYNGVFNSDTPIWFDVK